MNWTGFFGRVFLFDKTDVRCQVFPEVTICPNDPKRYFNKQQWNEYDENIEKKRLSFFRAGILTLLMKNSWIRSCIHTICSFISPLYSHSCFVLPTLADESNKLNITQ